MLLVILIFIERDRDVHRLLRTDRRGEANLPSQARLLLSVPGTFTFMRLSDYPWIIVNVDCAEKL